MKLKSFGCSFIFGSELSDAGLNGPYVAGSLLTWPALLAKQLGYEYQTYARPGSGNLQIMDRVLNQITDEPTLFVIGWTWVDRFDYVSEDSPMWYPKDPQRWSTIMPGDNTNVAQNYYRDIHSEYRDKLASLTAVRVAIDTLKFHNQPFIMTYMDELLFDTAYHSSPAVKLLQDYVKPYMRQFDGLNFAEWSKKNGYPIGVAAHPLEEAHEAAFNYILKFGIDKV